MPAAYYSMEIYIISKGRCFPGISAHHYPSEDGTTPEFFFSTWSILNVIIILEICLEIDRANKIEYIFDYFINHCHKSPQLNCSVRIWMKQQIWGIPQNGNRNGNREGGKKLITEFLWRRKIVWNFVGILVRIRLVSLILKCCVIF